jgi:hypothetical protein
MSNVASFALQTGFVERLTTGVCARVPRTETTTKLAGRQNG